NMGERRGLAEIPHQPSARGRLDCARPQADLSARKFFAFADSDRKGLRRHPAVVETRNDESTDGHELCEQWQRKQFGSRASTARDRGRSRTGSAATGLSRSPGVPPGPKKAPTPVIEPPKENERGVALLLDRTGRPDYK